MSLWAILFPFREWSHLLSWALGGNPVAERGSGRARGNGLHFLAGGEKGPDWEGGIEGEKCGRWLGELCERVGWGPQHGEHVWRAKDGACVQVRQGKRWWWGGSCSETLTWGQGDIFPHDGCLLTILRLLFYLLFGWFWVDMVWLGTGDRLAAVLSTATRHKGQAGRCGTRLVH